MRAPDVASTWRVRLRPRNSGALCGAALAVVLTVLLAVLLAGLLPLSSAAREGAFRDAVSTFTIENGLQVVVVEDHRAPVVTHMIWYKVGAADDPPGKSGLAHFFEHLFFMGTEQHPEGEFSDVVAELGGEDNAFTSHDFTAYFQRVARGHLGLMMDYEADRMAGLRLSDRQVETERRVVLEERLSEVDNDPAALLSEAVDALLFQSHPYRRPIVGWRHEIEALTKEDALRFYDDYYRPDNAVVVVAGDVAAEEVRALAEATYGQVERRAATPPRLRPREPEPRAARTAVLASRLVDQERLERHWVVPSYTTAQHGEAASLEVLAEIIGREGTGRLHRSLVVEQQLAASAAAWYEGTGRDETRFSLSAEPRGGVSLDELASGFDAVVAELVSDGIFEEELERAKRSLIADTIFAWDSQVTVAQLYGVALATGLTVEDANRWAESVRRVSAADVVTAAERFLSPRRAATGFLRGAQ